MARYRYFATQGEDRRSYVLDADETATAAIREWGDEQDSPVCVLKKGRHGGEVSRPTVYPTRGAHRDDQ